MNNKIPKVVLFISSRADIGAGGENYLITLLKYLDKDQFKPIIVLPHDGSLRQYFESNNIEVVVIDAKHGWLQVDAAWYSYIEGLQSRVKILTALILEKNISLIHTNSNHRFEGALAAQLSGIPNIHLAHIEYSPELPVFTRLPLSRATFAKLVDQLSDKIVAVSHSVASTLSPYISRKDKIHVIHNGLELELFDKALSKTPDTFKQSLNLPKDSILITAVGRITPDKGFDYFIEVANIILKSPGQNKKTYFIIAGKDEDIEFSNLLKTRTAEYGIKNNVLFLGFREDIPYVLAASDIFVLSSRKEGHPYVMLEAMACKCSVVAFNCAGVEETIEDSISGFIVPIGDTYGMSERITRLLESSKLRASIANSAREKVRTCFRADKTAIELTKVYLASLETPVTRNNSVGIELFLQNCTELGRIGKTNSDVLLRLKRLENLADVIQYNYISKSLRGLRKIFNKLNYSRR